MIFALLSNQFDHFLATYHTSQFVSRSFQKVKEKIDSLTFLNRVMEFGVVNFFMIIVLHSFSLSSTYVLESRKIY